MLGGVGVEIDSPRGVDSMPASAWPCSLYVSSEQVSISLAFAWEKASGIWSGFHGSFGL